MPREPISKDIMHFEPPYSILRNPVKGLCNLIDKNYNF